jgi:ABC-2 type transport system ATP-binding protein
MYDGSLKGIIEQFSSHKLINVRFANGQPTDTLDQIGQIVRQDGPEISFQVARVDVPRIAGRLLREYNVEDINIQEPPIEDVISEVFQTQQHIANDSTEQ